MESVQILKKLKKALGSLLELTVLDWIIRYLDVLGNFKDSVILCDCEDDVS